MRAFYEGIFAAFGPTKLEFHEMLWDGDSCAIRFSMTGAHVAESMGVPPTTSDILLVGIKILHFDGDQVVERFSQADMLGLLIQIGAVPAPG